MPNKPQPKPWLNKYPVLDDADHNSLEADAAINEFKLGMPKDQAEASDHKDYLKQHALKVAAHHLQGIRVANASNAEEAAKMHGKAFEAAMKHAGLSTDKVLPEVQALVDSSKPLYNYKSHPADAFFLPKDDEGKPNTKPEEPHADNARIKAVIDGLGKLKDLLS